ncbi:urea carboxylase-associated family protein [Curvibacter sp. CHRR-16]|uniref:urea amidolyase associated protein UAAP1 n=1 Tax=Curvibacter sp. CHRR-16 TaxID=2835872 RepID=UPI001BDB4235|nr:urea amidolyase associated protein UAAP1 [Curvibacter sp. CHRR-16]MBT0568986.1 urea carboxylase-associated family protein [Curvibacter sp. CHRR-16]
MTNPIPNDKLLWTHEVPAGTHWSGLIRRGTVLRFTDVEGGANCALYFFNPEDKLERYNMPDTLKAQHTALLSRGHCLYSDMGRIFASIVADSVGWHDSFCGVSDADMVRQRYGDSHYQQDRNAMLRNGRDSLLIELGKYGLGPRDLGPTINLFSKVQPDDAGQLQYVHGHSSAGSYVDLRFEMNTLVCLSTAPHPLNHSPRYDAHPVLLSAYRADPVATDDYCRNFRPENQRGFTNTERYVGL